MVLAELKQFLNDCIEKKIAFPKNTMKVVIDDFYDVVPEEHHATKDLEFNHFVGNEIAKVQIIPKP
jgi:hypothetical protein